VCPEAGNTRLPHPGAALDARRCPTEPFGLLARIQVEAIACNACTNVFRPCICIGSRADKSERATSVSPAVCSRPCSKASATSEHRRGCRSLAGSGLGMSAPSPVQKLSHGSAALAGASSRMEWLAVHGSHPNLRKIDWHGRSPRGSLTEGTQISKAGGDADHSCEQGGRPWRSASPPNSGVRCPRYDTERWRNARDAHPFLFGQELGIVGGARMPSVIQRLLGGQLYHCNGCRLQFYDLRPRRRRGPVTASATINGLRGQAGSP
jgi:hypothetical protein